MPTLSHITLELARERDHPMGDRNYGYHLYLPLSDDGRIDTDAWQKLRSACRVRRFRPGEEERHGRILRGSGGRWSFDYDDRGDFDDEVGFRLGDEIFVPGEYVSVRENDGEMHTFQVISVRLE